MTHTRFDLKDATFVSTDLQITILKAALARLESRHTAACEHCEETVPESDLQDVDNDLARRVKKHEGFYPDGQYCPQCRHAWERQYPAPVSDGSDEAYENHCERTGRPR